MWCQKLERRGNHDKLSSLCLTCTKSDTFTRVRLAGYFALTEPFFWFKSDQMAEWYGASGSVDLGFDSESGQTNDFKIGIHSFPA